MSQIPRGIAKISDEQNATAQIRRGQCVFYGIIIKTDGANDVTISVWDSLTATGKKLIPEDIIIEGSKRVESIGYPLAIWCTIGIRVKLSVAGGGAASYQVLYDSERD